MKHAETSVGRADTSVYFTKLAETSAKHVETRAPFLNVFLS